MWKPGNIKPEGSTATAAGPAQQTPTAGPPNSKMNHLLQTSPNTPGSAKTPRKRLSGSTMNMKFMKRKKEMNQNEAMRRAAMNKQDTTSSPAAAAAKSPAHSQQQADGPVEMEIEQSTETMRQSLGDADNGEHDEHNNTEIMYAQATSIDMYGMEAALIGRRSFRGFNPPIERAYQESKNSVENRGDAEKPQQKISDEELIQRYQDIVKERDGGGGRGRGVGNLDSKFKKRKRPNKLG